MGHSRKLFRMVDVAWFRVQQARWLIAFVYFSVMKSILFFDGAIVSETFFEILKRFRITVIIFTK